MSFRQSFAAKKQYIDSLVESKAADLNSPSELLLSAQKYSIASGGKRLRAILALEFFSHFDLLSKQKHPASTATNPQNQESLAKACQPSGQDAQACCNPSLARSCLVGKEVVSKELELFFVAIEILHLYTLVHDDLPCMDNDDFRRGRLSNHKVFGQTMALLCGDALLNCAYELLLEGALKSGGRKEYLEACLQFAKFAGGGGLIGGQALEFDESRKPNEQNSLRIYRHKTCDLICASVAAGAILAGANTLDVETAKEFGYHFGIAFQIRDDLLDITEKGEIEKNSLLGLIGEKNANIILEQSIFAAHQCLDKLQVPKDAFLRQLTDFAVQRKI